MRRTTRFRRSQGSPSALGVEVTVATLAETKAMGPMAEAVMAAREVVGGLATVAMVVPEVVSMGEEMVRLEEAQGVALEAEVPPATTRSLEAGPPG